MTDSSEINIISDNKENIQVNNNKQIISNYQQENLNNKIYLIQKQFEIKELDYLNQIQILNNQINSIKQIQKQLRTELEQKDKAISEFNNIIKDYQLELLKYKEKLEKINFKYLKYKEKLISIKSNISSSSELYLSSNNKNIYETKMKELMESINEKNKKMNDMQNKIKNLEIKNNELIIENKNLKNDNKEYKTIKDDLNKKIDEINNLTKKNIEIDSSFNEKNKLLENKINELNNETNVLIKESNDNINIISEWIEKYLYVDKQNMNNDEYNIPQILSGLSIGINIQENNNKINFIKLIKILENIRNKIIKDKQNQKEKEEEKNDINKNNDNYIESYNSLKIEINKLYNKLIEDIGKNKFFYYKKENKENFDFDDLEKVINEYVKFMRKSREDNKDNENIIIINKLLKKKISNLEINIQLKQMEINSLQEIIERRVDINKDYNKNLVDLLNSSDISIKSQSNKNIRYNCTK